MTAGRACSPVGLGLATALALGLPAPDADGQGRTRVALELVLAIDVSASVDRDEFALQIDGIAAAFRHPDVIAAIERAGPGGIAVALVEWSEPESTLVAVPFQQVADERSARAFAFLATRAWRITNSSYTSIGAGISAGLELIKANDFDGARQVIDVSGDGRNNRAPWLDQVRERVLAAGVTVNGLAIETDDDGLARYYREQVIMGADAFVERARDYTAYAGMIRRKLIREILPPVSGLPVQLDVASAGDGP